MHALLLSDVIEFEDPLVSTKIRLLVVERTAKFWQQLEEWTQSGSFNILITECCQTASIAKRGAAVSQYIKRFKIRMSMKKERWERLPVRLKLKDARWAVRCFLVYFTSHESKISVFRIIYLFRLRYKISISIRYLSENV